LNWFRNDNFTVLSLTDATWMPHRSRITHHVSRFTFHPSPCRPPEGLVILRILRIAREAFLMNVAIGWRPAAARDCRNPAGCQKVAGGRLGCGGGDLRVSRSEQLSTPAGVAAAPCTQEVAGKARRQLRPQVPGLRARRGLAPLPGCVPCNPRFPVVVPCRPERPPATFCQPYRVGGSRSLRYSMGWTISPFQRMVTEM
jgi:hypothetical protein